MFRPFFYNVVDKTNNIHHSIFNFFILFFLIADEFKLNTNNIIYIKYILNVYNIKIKLNKKLITSF